MKIVTLNPFRETPITKYTISYQNSTIKLDIQRSIMNMPNTIYLMDSDFKEILMFECYTFRYIGYTTFKQYKKEPGDLNRKIELRFSESQTLEISEFNLLLI